MKESPPPSPAHTKIHTMDNIQASIVKNPTITFRIDVNQQNVATMARCFHLASCVMQPEMQKAIVPRSMFDKASAVVVAPSPPLTDAWKPTKKPPMVVNIHTIMTSRIIAFVPFQCVMKLLLLCLRFHFGISSIVIYINTIHPPLMGHSTSTIPASSGSKSGGSTVFLSYNAPLKLAPLRSALFRLAPRKSAPINPPLRSA